MKALCFLLLAAGLLVNLPSIAQEKWQPPADLASAFLLTVDGKSVWQSNADKRLPPASLTKLVAALVLAENPNLKDWVRISQKASMQDGTKLNLQFNERFRAAELLGAILIRSANDACQALAEWDAGSEVAFVKKMNAKVAMLKLKNTHFTNPCGFDAENHYSTVNDLAVIAQLANVTPQIKVWTDIKSYTIKSKSTPEKSGKQYSFISSNLLLGRVEGVDGLKTGYTKKAGKCLIAHAIRNKKELILVMLNAPDRWWGADALINRAFEDAIS